MDRKSWLKRHKMLVSAAAFVGVIAGMTIALHTSLPFLVDIFLGAFIAGFLAWLIPNLGWWLAPNGRKKHP